MNHTRKMGELEQIHLHDIIWDHSVWVEGWLTRLAEALGHPVLFVEFSDAGKGEIIEEKARIYKQIAPFCGILGDLIVQRGGKDIKWRNCFCLDNDRQIAEELYHHYKANLLHPTYMKKYEITRTNGKQGTGERTVWYKQYVCPFVGFTEWAIPLFVNHSIVGVFITGQFRGRSFDPIKAKTQMIRKMTETEIPQEQQKKIIEEFENYSGIAPSEDMTNMFFTYIDAISTSLQNAYKQKRAVWLSEVENEVIRYVCDTDNRYPESTSITIKSYSDFTMRFRAARTRLFEGMFYFKERYGLTNMTVFKPVSEVGNVSQSGRIDGAILKSEDMPLDLLRKVGVSAQGVTDKDNKEYNRGFCPSESYLANNTVAWSEWVDIESKDAPFLLFKHVSGAACAGWIDDESGIVCYDHCDLYIFTTSIGSRFAVAYLLEFPNEVLRENVDQWALQILRSASIAFMMQWKTIDSDVQAYQSNEGSKHITHEVGSIAIGMSGLTKQIETYLAKGEVERWANATKFELEYPAMNELLIRADEYTINMEVAQALIQINSQASVFANDSRIPEKKLFFPYDQILFKWFAILQQQCGTEGKKIEAPSRISAKDSDRPEMFSDPLLVEQIVYNLLNNARKYSHPGSKIHVDCMLSKDRKNYLIEVINYGEPFSDDEDIFAMGVRGSNVSEMSGTGFGLYIARKYARLLGGDLVAEKPEVLSEYFIPFLGICARLAAEGSEKKQQYTEEIERLKSLNIYYEVNAPIGVSRRHEPLYYERMIDNVTAKIKFICSIPYNAKGSAK